jgi:hypothetical protein
MSDAQRRALRTLFQAVVAGLSAGLLSLVFPSLTAEWVTVITVVLTPVLSQLQNSLEDSGTIRTVLKDDISLPSTPGD